MEQVKRKFRRSCRRLLFGLSLAQKIESEQDEGAGMVGTAPTRAATTGGLVGGGRELQEGSVDGER